MKYILDITMESEDRPTDEQFTNAIKAAAKELNGVCISWGLHGIATESGKSIFDTD